MNKRGSKKLNKVSKKIRKASKKINKVSKKNKSSKRNFGSIFGLQGSDMQYSGVYPMTMKMYGQLPNLDNVVRDFHV